MPEETWEEKDGITEEKWQREEKGSLLPRDYSRDRKRVKREGEQKSDSLTAAPNGFSGEKKREGAQRRRRHNEGAMTEAEIDLER